MKIPLIEACIDGSLAEVDKLLASCDIKTVKDDCDWTPLMAACCNDRPDVVAKLLTAGADVLAVDQDGWTPLLYAVDSANIKVVAQLLAAGAHQSVDAATKDGWRAAHFVAREGATQVLEVLLAAQVNVSAQTSEGWAPLMLAAKEGHIETVKMLIDAGADVLAVDELGQSAIFFASQSDYFIEQGNLGIVEALIAAGAELSTARAASPASICEADAGCTPAAIPSPAKVKKTGTKGKKEAKKGNGKIATARRNTKEKSVDALIASL